MKIDVVKSLALASVMSGLVAAAPAFAAEPNVTYKCPGRIYSCLLYTSDAADE